jgi:novobiocin biosynthesis protein NovU/D-mycarose 3-C-methyltransferase
MPTHDLRDPVRPVTACRVCHSSDLALVLDLGAVPLANALLTRADLASVQGGGPAEPRFPLSLLLCERCGHVGLSVVVDPILMFQKYPYVTGTSPTMRAHFAALATSVHARLPPAERFVVEIGSNDGTLLAAMQECGARGAPVRVLGVDPANNIASLARARGVPTVAEIFSNSLAKTIRAEQGGAGAFLGNNVVAHIDDLADLISGARTVLHEDGLFVFEVPHVLSLFERVEFDTIYHEHLSYFSLACLSRWLADAGMPVFDVEEQTVHGGTLRVWASPNARRQAESPDGTGRVNAVLMREHAAGIARADTWKDFATKVDVVRRELPALLADRRTRLSRRVGGYGAAAKGSTMLCTSGVDSDALAYVVDRNPLKQGMYTPGTHIEIVGPERLETDPVDDLLVLAWNLVDEIVTSLPGHRAHGGAFLVPVPRPRVLP